MTAIDRGLVADRQPIFAEIRRSPWGAVARRVERYCSYREPDGVTTLFRLAVDRARERVDESDREAVAERVRAAVARSGSTQARFAERIGTSASRLSTDASGKVTPSAAMLLRIELVADEPRTETLRRHATE